MGSNYCRLCWHSSQLPNKYSLTPSPTLNKVQNQHNARQFSLVRSKEERDEITKKLNTFYGPIKQLRTQQGILYGKFAYDLRNTYLNANEKRFRTLRYLLEGQEFGSQDRELLEQILDINKKFLNLIEGNSGLVDKPELQELLGKVAAHMTILQLAYNKKLKGPAELFEDIVFPLEINGAIESAILRLEDRLKELSDFEKDINISAAIKTENDTIRYYNSNADVYATQTLFLPMENLYTPFFKGAKNELTGIQLDSLPEGARLLDAGCGAGRDVRYFISRGYIVVGFDAAAGMVRKCQEYPHAYCKQMSFADVDYKEEFEGVWACASLLHLETAQAQDAIKKLTTALKPGGRMFIAVKKGEVGATPETKIETKKELKKAASADKRFLFTMTACQLNNSISTRGDLILSSTGILRHSSMETRIRFLSICF